MKSEVRAGSGFDLNAGIVMISMHEEWQRNRKWPVARTSVCSGGNRGDISF